MVHRGMQVHWRCQIVATTCICFRHCWHLFRCEKSRIRIIPVKICQVQAVYDGVQLSEGRDTSTEGMVRVR
jgi:hypothetical protein